MKNKIPLRIKLFMQWLQFWAWVGGVLLGVRMGSPEDLVELEEKDEKHS